MTSFSELHLTSIVLEKRSGEPTGRLAKPLLANTMQNAGSLCDSAWTTWLVCMSCHAVTTSDLGISRPQRIAEAGARLPAAIGLAILPNMTAATLNIILVGYMLVPIAWVDAMVIILYDFCSRILGTIHSPAGSYDVSPSLFRLNVTTSRRC